MDDSTQTHDDLIINDPSEDKQLDLDGNERVNSDVQTLLTIESAIKNNISRIDRLKEDLKPVNEMMKNYLTNDEAYNKLTEVAKKASTEKGARKRDLMNHPNGRELADKIEVLKSELSEAEEALSDYLSEYQKQTGLNEFEGADGELRQIVYKAKLVRKTNLNRD